MALNINDLPKHIRDQIEREYGATTRSKPSRAESGERTIGRCIPADGTTCDWTGHQGAAWERHVKATGHGRLELIDTAAAAVTEGNQP